MWKNLLQSTNNAFFALVLNNRLRLTLRCDELLPSWVQTLKLRSTKIVFFWWQNYSFLSWFQHFFCTKCDCEGDIDEKISTLEDDMKISKANPRYFWSQEAIKISTDSWDDVLHDRIIYVSRSGNFTAFYIAYVAT